MKRTLLIVIATIVAVLVIEAAGWFVFLYSGTYNISIYNHDNRPANWALDTGMTRSVTRHAQRIKAPSNLNDPATIQMGFEHYHEMCVTCHGAPGVAPDEIGKGLWPTAPDLAKTAPDWTTPQLFWIIKNGIKFTAMPAWGPTHSDDEVWAMTAFVQKLPHLSPAEYKEMEQKLPKEGDHHHEEASHDHGETSPGHGAMEKMGPP